MSDMQSGDTVPLPLGLEAGWWATDLGARRPCGATYERYPYESLPPLDSGRFTGAFEWLGEPGASLPAQVAAIDALTASLAGHGIALPEDFGVFHSSANLHDVLDEVSVTACWTSISQPLPSPIEPGAFLVRFLRDQQDCLLWYLYLRPSGEAFVVCSYLDYEYAYENEEPETDPVDRAEQRAALLWCAPSFEEFAYRFWVENRIWHAVNSTGDSPLEPSLREYLHHYEVDAVVGA